AVSLAFATDGWSVGIHYYRHKEAAEDTLRQVVAAGGAGTLFEADIREPQEVEQMVAACFRLVPPPSVFVCNAGIGGGSLVLREREQDWAGIVATNLTGTFHCVRAMAPPLLARGGGSIIVVGSHTGFHGATGQAAYATSKAGLIGLVKTAALEWGPQNIQVHLVLPGWQKTGLTEGLSPDGEGWLDHALRRPPAIEEVAGTIVHLARLRGISGQVWNCDSRNL